MPHEPADHVRRMPGEAPQKKWNTCLIGCVGAVLVLAAVTAVMAFVAHSMLTHFRDLITDTEPMPLEAVVATPEETAEVMDRVNDFLATAGQVDGPRQIELSGRDINIYLRNHPDYAWLGECAYISMDGDQLSGEVCVPLSWIPGAKGRYLNGTATFAVAANNGALDLRVRNLEVKGTPVPSMALENINRELQTDTAHQDPELKEALMHVDRIEIVDGKMIITLKGES